MTKNLSLASAFAVHGLAARAGTHVRVDPVCSVGIFIIVCHDTEQLAVCDLGLSGLKRSHRKSPFQYG